MVYVPYSLMLAGSIAGDCKKVALKDTEDETEQVFL